MCLLTLHNCLCSTMQICSVDLLYKILFLFLFSSFFTQRSIIEQMPNKLNIVWKTGLEHCCRKSLLTQICGVTLLSLKLAGWSPETVMVFHFFQGHRAALWLQCFVSLSCQRMNPWPIGLSSFFTCLFVTGPIAKYCFLQYCIHLIILHRM